MLCLRRKGEDGVAPARAVAFLSGALAPILARTSLVAVDAKLVAETIIFGAHTLSDVSASVRFTPGAPLHLRFDLGLPGHSRMSGEGDLETSAAPKFDGMVDFSSEDFALFRQWASPGGSRLPPISRRLATRSRIAAPRFQAMSRHRRPAFRDAM